MKPLTLPPRKLGQILPQTLPLLMGAGPVPVPEAVARANTLVINHLGPTMNEVVDGIVQMGRYVFQTEGHIFGISGPSSAGMEMAVTSLLHPGRSVLVLNLGTFSQRFSELARGVGASVTELKPAHLSAFTVEEVRTALTAGHYDVLTIVQGETSCGIKNVELEGIVKLAHAHGLMTIVDGVCTLSTMPLEMDAWGIDVVVTGGQKGLSSIAGVSLIAFSGRAFDYVSARQAPLPHWCLDPRRAHKFWALHEYHYTAPVSGVLALYEALRLICEETLPARFARHEASSLELQTCLEVMGLELYAPASCRLNSVLAIKNAAGISAKALLTHMRQEYNVEISGAFGLDIVRIGQMGEQARPHNVRRALEALGLSYQALGAQLNVPEALRAFDAHQNPKLKVCG